MEVKTESGGTFEAAGNGTKALGITGTVLGGLGLLGNGLLAGGNWFGGIPNMMGNVNGYSRNGTNTACNSFVTMSEYNQGKEYNSLFADYCMEKAERYTDKAVIAQAEKEAVKDAKLAQDLLDIGIGVTKIDQQVIADREKNLLREQIINLKMSNLEEKIKNAEDKLSGAVAFEAERRKNGDENLFNYVRGTYVPGKLIMPKDSICPEYMPRFNSWTAPTD